MKRASARLFTPLVEPITRTNEALGRAARHKLRDCDLGAEGYEHAFRALTRHLHGSAGSTTRMSDLVTRGHGRDGGGEDGSGRRGDALRVAAL